MIVYINERDFHLETRYVSQCLENANTYGFEVSYMDMALYYKFIQCGFLFRIYTSFVSLEGFLIDYVELLVQSYTLAQLSISKDFLIGRSIYSPDYFSSLINFVWYFPSGMCWVDLKNCVCSGRLTAIESGF